MSGVVGVRFVKAGKIYYFDPGDARPGVNEYVVVETEQGQELGAVVIAPDQVVMTKVKGELPKIIRPATPGDLQTRDRLSADAKRYLERCRELVHTLGISMKTLDAHFTLDGSRLIISYSSEDRVDSRDLLRELGQNRSLAIDLRQVGPRDETKILGGLGRCGRELCCSTWLTEFQPISMKMAKEQDLPLSPPGLAGVCGRLRCCLRYEYDQYREMKRGLPRIGAKVMTEHGAAVVVVGHPLKQSITVRIEETGTWADVPMSALLDAPPPSAAVATAEPDDEEGEAPPPPQRRRR